MKMRELSDAMIRDITERYPELKKATWEETRAFLLERQAESAAQVEIAIRNIDVSRPGKSDST